MITPWPPVYPTGAVVRWVLWDPADDDVFTFPINPNAMSSPERQQNLRTGVVSPIDNRSRSFRSRAVPHEFTFGGVIRSKAHHDALREWSEKTGLIHLADHLHRTFDIRFVSFEPEDRRPTPLVSWRLKYTMKCLSYGRTP